MSDFFDIHSHLNFPDYGNELPDVISRLDETNTYTITVGTDLKSSQRAVELAKENQNIFACVGVHPVDDPSQDFGEKEFEKLMDESKVVAIGECGLDYFHKNKDDKKETDRQKELFIRQIDFAMRFKKPIMIHSRDAYSELLDILEPIAKKEGDKLRGDVHFFAGDIDVARRFFDIGFTVSFTGVLTFTHDYDDVVRFAPIDMIMSETDAPFVAPVPYRGKRNEPSYVSEVVKKMAVIRDEDFEEVKVKMVENAMRVFGIK